MFRQIGSTSNDFFQVLVSRTNSDFFNVLKHTEVTKKIHKSPQKDIKKGETENELVTEQLFHKK